MYISSFVNLCFGRLYNLFVELRIDKGLVWIILSGEALLPPVVTYGVVFTECGNMINVVLVDI